VKADASTLTFARDGSKNVRAELNASGAVTASFRYRAYGQIAQSTSPSPSYLGLASQVVDPSGLYYMRARWYDAVTARFMTRDALVGDANAPATVNAFGYPVNPLTMSDPSGLVWQTEDGAEIDEDADPILRRLARGEDVSIDATRLRRVGGSVTPESTITLEGERDPWNRILALAIDFFTSPGAGPCGIALPRLGPPVAMTGRWQHALDQMAARDGGRGVTDRAVQDAFDNFQSIKEQSNGRWQFKGRDATVILESDGELVTAWGTNRRGLRNPP